MTRMDAEAVLSELLEVSTIISAALIASRDGETLAASIGGSRVVDDAATQLGTRIAGLIARAERAQVELGREPITQLEIAVGDGSVLIVMDGSHIVAVVTSAVQMAGLAFYDLKTALRSLRADAQTRGTDELPATATNEGSTV